MGGTVAKLRNVLGLGLVAVATGMGPPPAVASLSAQDATAIDSPLARFPGLGRTYHHVSGRTVEQIGASLDRLDLTDPASGERIHAYTEWRLRWWIPEDGEGGCLLDQAEVQLDVTVALPRLVNAAAIPGDLRERWQRYLAALEAHEAVHVRNAYRTRGAMLRAIRQADCASANEIAAEAMDALRRRNEDFDRQSRHGEAEGARFP